MADFSHNTLIFFLRNWWKQVNFGRKNCVGGVRTTTFVEHKKSFNLVYYRPSNDFCIKSYDRIQSQFFDLFSSKSDENKWIFFQKNWGGRFRPTIFEELKKSFNLVYYRPSNDFWIKSFGRTQSQIFDFFSSKYDENKWILAEKIVFAGFGLPHLWSSKSASICYNIGPATIYGSRVMAVFSHSFSILFPPNLMKTS